MAKKQSTVVKDLSMELIDEPAGRIRLEISDEKITDLANNIQQIGLQQPIVVRAVEARFEIVAGHRRFLAFRKLGRKTIPCIIRMVSDAQCALIRASENLRRVDLSPIEEAAVYADLRDTHGMTVDQIAKQMGPTSGVVKRRLDLLKMPPQLQQAIHLKQISYGVGEELWRITDLGQMDYYLGYAVEHGITVAVAREWVTDWKKSLLHKGSDVGGAGRDPATLEPKPTYVTCQTCHGPTDVSQAEYICVCRACLALIVAATSKGSQE